mgnify:CR=1 FL=1
MVFILTGFSFSDRFLVWWERGGYVVARMHGCRWYDMVIFFR